MIGKVGDGPSWHDQVTREEAKKSACKRKKTDTEQQTLGRPFSLGSQSDRKGSMDAIYEHVVSQEPPQRNLASWAISTYYSEFTPPAVKMVASQVLCMIAEYHLACATKGSTTTSPILPETVEPYLPLLVHYAHPAGTGITANDLFLKLCRTLFAWFSYFVRSVRLFWGIFVRGLHVETFVRVLRSSRVNLTKCK